MPRARRFQKHHANCEPCSQSSVPSQSSLVKQRTRSPDPQSALQDVATYAGNRRGFMSAQQRPPGQSSGASHPITVQVPRRLHAHSSKALTHVFPLLSGQHAAPASHVVLPPTSHATPEPIVPVGAGIITPPEPPPPPRLLPAEPLAPAAPPTPPAPPVSAPPCAPLEPPLPAWLCMVLAAPPVSPSPPHAVEMHRIVTHDNRSFAMSCDVSTAGACDHLRVRSGCHRLARCLELEGNHEA
jgi:hypothetical protein